MVVQERGSSRYQLGPAVLRLGNVYLDTLELRSKADPVGRGPRPADRPGRAHRGAADRRRRDHPPRAAPRRQPADARGRHRHPGPRQRPRQGDARLPARGREARARRRRAAQHDRRDAHRRRTTLARPAGADPVHRHRPRAGRGGDRRERPGEPGLRLVRRGRRRDRRRDPVRQRRSHATRPATWCARRRAPSPASWAPRRGHRAAPADLVEPPAGVPALLGRDRRTWAVLVGAGSRRIPKGSRFSDASRGVRAPGSARSHWEVDSHWEVRPRAGNLVRSVRQIPRYLGNSPRPPYVRYSGSTANPCTSTSASASHSRLTPMPAIAGYSVPTSRFHTSPISPARAR